ncbi:prepilin peptidase [Yinghuangia seranimata]|uniref:prepilin peptidase n=1 Tax=Yinghuangia seranimata TaxID=408067 RepID=UPI003CCF70CF
MAVRRGTGPWSWPPLVLAAVSPYLAYTDLRWRRLPNRALTAATSLTLGMLAAAGLGTGPVWRTERALICGAIAVTVAASAALAGAGLGGGDAKLIGVIGLCLGGCGWTYPVAALFIGFAAAAVWAVGVVVVARPTPSPRTVPLGPFLTAGALLTLCLPMT